MSKSSSQAITRDDFQSLQSAVEQVSRENAQLLQLMGKLHAQFEEGFRDVRQEIATVRDEMRAGDESLLNGIQTVDASLRTEIQAVDTNLRVEIQAVRGEIRSVDERLRGEIRTVEKSLRGEIQTVDENLRGEIQAVDGSLCREIRTIDENLRGEMKAVEKALREEMRRGFMNQGKQIEALTAEQQLFRKEIAQLGTAWLRVSDTVRDTARTVARETAWDWISPAEDRIRNVETRLDRLEKSGA